MTKKEQELTRLVETLTAKRDELQEELKILNHKFRSFRKNIIFELEAAIPVKYDSLVHYIEGGGLG